MIDVVFRCSSIGKLMTEPRTKSEGPLSVGAKTYIRELVAQEVYGVEFEVSSKAIEKGLLMESDAIDMLNRNRGLSLQKNSTRLTRDGLTGECDLFDAERKRGHDLKCSWSLQTFPILPIDCEDRLYEWQMRGYMALWDADEWEVNYCLLDTPDHLIGYEAMQLHVVSHIPERMRITTWAIQRDAAKEAAIFEKLKHAAAYYHQAIEQFNEQHKEAA